MIYDKSVFIGRLQPFHNGHLHNILKCFDLSNNVHIILGSGKTPRTVKNPFSDDERILMVLISLKPIMGKPEKVDENVYKFDNKTITFHSIMDKLYSDNAWIQDVQTAVAQVQGERIIQVGHNKDNLGLHLDMFPHWDFYDSELVFRHNGDTYNSSDFRKEWYELGEFPESWKDCIPEAVVEFISNFDNSNLIEEYEYLVEYPKKWGKGPFVTVDAVVTCLGHVLMVKRGHNPGKGNYAIPGGFLEHNETILYGTIRELKEETKIKVPPKILETSVVNSHVFDSPLRSSRGRVITFAYHIELSNENGLPKVKGGDDAAEAFWVPLSKVDSLTHMIYEDHYSIIKYFV